MQFADIKNEFVFRKIFYKEPETAPLISFLNAALALTDEARIVSVTLISPYLLPRFSGESTSILDVRATDQSGRKFVVEMQVAEKSGFDKRVQYYIAKDYSQQIQVGEDYPLLHPAYFIGILDFPFDSGSDYHTRHLIMNQATNEHLLKDIQFSFIELPKFTKEMHELETPIDKWAYFLKHAVELDIIPDFAQEDEGLKTAFIEADKHKWNEVELMDYTVAGMRRQDARGEKEFAIEKAVTEANLKVAKNLKAMDLSNEAIKQATGLSDDEIAAI